MLVNCVGAGELFVVFLFVFGSFVPLVCSIFILVFLGSISFARRRFVLDFLGSISFARRRFVFDFLGSIPLACRILVLGLLGSNCTFFSFMRGSLVRALVTPLLFSVWVSELF